MRSPAARASRSARPRAGSASAWRRSASRSRRPRPRPRRLPGVAIPGDPHDDILVDLLARARRAVPAGVAWTDAHTHTGSNDPDGVTGSAEELLAGLDRAGVARAVVFTTAEPGGYPPANDRVVREAAESGGRLTPFVRVDPNSDDPVGEARRVID